MNSIGVFYVSVGSGHQVAAEAIADVIRKHAPTQSIIVIDPFSTRFTNLPKLLSHVQAMIIRYAKGGYDYAWRQGVGSQGLGIFFRLGFFQQLLGRFLQPGATVICTHTLPMCIAAEMKRCNKIDRLYGIVTDYGAHHFWPISNVDGYFVAHKGLQDELSGRGIDPNLIKVTGIPVRASFQFQHRIPKNLPNPLRLVLIAGGLRHGAYIETHRILLAVLKVIDSFGPDRLEIVFVAGDQSKLQEQVKAIADEKKLRLTVYGFVEQIEQLISWSDLVVSKPGGLMVSEILAIGRGMIILPAGPGQETVNRQFLIDHDIGLPGDTLEAFTKSILYCLENPGYILMMQERARALGRPNAANCIAECIMAD